MADKRIRGAELQAMRRRHFRGNPLCVMCQAKGKVRLATELDHIKALVNGGTDTDDNRQGLCEPCHKDKTRIDMGHAPRIAIGLDGWPKESDDARRLAQP